MITTIAYLLIALNSLFLPQGNDNPAPSGQEDVEIVVLDINGG